MSQHSTRSVQDMDKTIGRRISELRVSKGLTRQDLAGKLGITHQQLYKYEMGVNRISASRLAEVAMMLGSPTADFYEVANEFSEASDGSRELSRAQIDFVRYFNRIHDVRQKAAIRDLVRALAETQS